MRENPTDVDVEVRLFPNVDDARNIVDRMFNSNPAIAEQIKRLLDAAEAFDKAPRHLSEEKINKLREAVDQAAYAANKMMTMEALSKAGIELVEVEYSGSGDEGSIDDVQYSPERPPQGFSFPAMGVEVEWSRDRRRDSIESISVFEGHINEDSLTEDADEAVEQAGFGGYQDNDGGGGKVFFHVKAEGQYPAGSIVVQHYFNVLHEEQQDAVVF